MDCAPVEDVVAVLDEVLDTPRTCVCGSGDDDHRALKCTRLADVCKGEIGRSLQLVLNLVLLLTYHH